MEDLKASICDGSECVHGCCLFMDDGKFTDESDGGAVQAVKIGCALQDSLITRGGGEDLV